MRLYISGAGDSDADPGLGIALWTQRKSADAARGPAAQHTGSEHGTSSPDPKTELRILTLTPNTVKKGNIHLALGACQET